MPAQPKTVRNIKLPMKCGDCHAIQVYPGTGDLAPVTFEGNCKECHRRELEFVLPKLAVAAPPAPHAKDGPKIREFIRETYRQLIAANPDIVKRPLERDLRIEPSPMAWLQKAAAMSERYLFDRKCTYCHEYESAGGDFPVVKKVNHIAGRYDANKVDGDPWLPRAEFGHRAHRAVACSSCHARARASTKTSDVLIPGMKTCVECHGSSGTRIDRCSQCHQYHNKTKELDRDRRPIEELIGALRRPGRDSRNRGAN